MRPVGHHPDRQLRPPQPLPGPGEQLDGHHRPGPELRPVLGPDAGQAHLAGMDPGQQRQGDGAPGRVQLSLVVVGEGRKVEGGDGIEEEIDEVILGEPVLGRGREEPLP
jgi:hypothetical protein